MGRVLASEENVKANRLALARAGGDGVVRGVLPRAASLLRALGAAPDPLTASQLSRTLGIPVQSVHRLLSELAVAGLTLQDRLGKRWTLGPLAIELGRAAGRQIALVRLGRPFLERLTEATRETAILTIRDGDHAVYADIVESPEPLRLTERVGMRLPLSVGASRRVILAFLPEAERRLVVERLAGAGLVAEPESLLDECALIRRRGSALSVGQLTAHTVGVSAPVLRGGTAVAALMVAGPEQRLGALAAEPAAALVVEQARALSQLVGGSDVLGGSPPRRPGQGSPADQVIQERRAERDREDR